MAETGFSVTYDGPALTDGRMEVRDLAPALLALGELFREANTIANPTQPAVTLQIRATERGSFTIELLIVQHGLQSLIDLFSGDAADALSNLKELLLAPSAVGLIWLIKRLRGRSIRRRDPQPDGTIRLVLDDETSLDVPAGTMQLHQRLTVRKLVREVLSPLDKDGVDIVQFRRDAGQEVTVEVVAGDLPSFEPREDAEQLLDSTVTMNLEISSVAFHEGNKWRLNDGAGTFWATIADQEFLDRVDARQESFAKGDILRCRIRFEQARTSEGLRTERTVEEVLEHIPASRPIGMLGEDPDSAPEESAGG